MVEILRRQTGSAVAFKANGERGEQHPHPRGASLAEGPAGERAAARHGQRGSTSEHLQLKVLSTIAEDSHASSRGKFVARAVVAGGAFVAGSALVAGFPRLGASAPSAAQDQKILNFALLLEYIEAGFYSEAFDKGKLSGKLLKYVSVVRGHERAHVAFLKSAVGKNARKKPALDFGDTTSDPQKFIVAAIALEETMIAAYNGQAANLTKPTLALAAKIVSVEARHAGWIRALAGENPAPTATDHPKTATEVQAAVNHTGFLHSS
jgi:rubrerythrin